LLAFIVMLLVADILGMQGEERWDRRASVVIPSHLTVDTEAGKASSPRSPSPDDLVPLWKQNAAPKTRKTFNIRKAIGVAQSVKALACHSEVALGCGFDPRLADYLVGFFPRFSPTVRMTSESAQYADTEVEELLTMLRETEHLEEQGDILQYLVDTQGLDFNTGIIEDGKNVTVKDLLKVLYEKACQQKLWGLVRHTAGMLGKRVEDLAKAVTDLLVRQKQVTVGMPPSNEHTITAPLPEIELRQLIHQAYGDDESTAMLTQELLVYLAMFIRTEPQLFLEMLRLRVGLIIQVMATELSRTLICTGEEASEHLLNLSPFEMKNLLHHILSGKEFAISSVGRGNFSVISCKSSRVSKKSQIGGLLGGDADKLEDVEPDRQGQWLRRRRLDGALNRVPRDFYPRVWGVLERVRMTERIEQRYCIKFCQKLGDSQSQTIRKILQVFGEDAMGVTQIKEWFNRFKDGRTSAESEQRCGRPQTARSAAVVERVRNLVMADRRLTVRRLPKRLDGCEIRAQVVVPEQKDLRRDVAQDLLDTANTDPGFLNTVITGDESWVYGYDPGTKRQSSQWKHPESPRPKKARQVRSKIKVMLTVFFDVRGIVHHEYAPEGQMVTKEYYHDVLWRLRDAVRRKRLDMWTANNWHLHHDNAPAHSSQLIHTFLAKHGITTVHQPPYSPDLAPCDFWLFPKLKTPLKGSHFESREEIMRNATTELNTIPKEDFQRCFRQWKDRWANTKEALEKCQGLAIEGRVLPQNLTQENMYADVLRSVTMAVFQMTPGELKFALAVETVLNSIPQPEYRQLVVEALMVLTLVTEYNVAGSLGGIIAVENLVHKANQIFLEDQMKVNGDATLCCAKPKEQREMTSSGGLLCGGAAYICQHFYDSAPSGSYGTMTYITRAVASLLDCLPRDGEMDCSIS
ncbi:hypothetical protein ANN_02212, partial [Periplaneta americana]